MSDHGMLTTNTVEGFYGLSLVYQDKWTDLGHTHYVCKTNMAISTFSLGERRTLHYQYGIQYYKAKPRTSDRVFM